jgi:formylglycine-generating enzyme required for sulfatase activity
MRRLVFFLLISTSSFAQKHNDWDLQSVNDTLFMDARETTLADWYNFLAFVKEDISEDSASALLPDTTLIYPAMRPLIKNAWASLYEEIDCPGKDRFERPVVSDKVYRKSKKINVPLFLSCTEVPDEFWDYPITGISYQQVQEYIAWKNSLVRKANENWVFRLPSPADWRKVARLAYEKSIHQYKSNLKEYEQIYTLTGRNNGGCLLLNIRNDSPCETDLIQAARYSRGGLFPSRSFSPNILGIYNLQGNVSEMTSIRGVAAGGNYSLSMEEAHFGSVQSYAKPESWLGFRCVAQKG